MGHVKVVRRSMKTEEWNELRFGWLKRHIYDVVLPINNVLIKEARQVSENEYEYYDSDFKNLNIGDMYYTPDGSAFIKADFYVPDELLDKEYYLYLKTPSEMIVKCNGVYIGGIDPNRETVNVSSYVKEKALHFEIEGFNRSKPDDERNPNVNKSRGCRQIFEGASIVTKNNDVLSLIYDIELLSDIVESGIFDEAYSDYLTESINKSLSCIDFDNFVNDDVLKASEIINKYVYENKMFKGDGIVELIAHSHLDIAYYWRKIHTVQKNLRTCLIQMRLMDKYPDFKYCHSQAYCFETIEKYYLEVFDELKIKINEGRFEPVGGMYVEPDCNIPNAESLIRQCLYGQQYYREKFGFIVENCWLPDVFGNSWILPQILIKSGMKYFVSNKMSTWNDTNRFPHNNFIWKGIDGSCVFACVPPTHFISWNMPSQIKENWDAYQDKSSGSNTVQMFGYGDGGSGCTEEMIELMNRFNKLSSIPETNHTTGKEFLERNFDSSKDFETWDGELYLEMHRGTFTTKAILKDLNRKTEEKFRNAELLSSLRMKNGQEYPSDVIRDTYKTFMVNQFHDILPGSHITPVYNDALNDFNKVDNELSKIIGTCEKFFNTLNFKRNLFSFISDDNGKIVRKGIKGRYVYTFAESLSQAVIPCYTECEKWFNYNDNLFENDFYKVKLNADCSVISLYDKVLDREWVKGDFNKLKIYHDNPGNYCAWDILPNYNEVESEISIVNEIKINCWDEECCEFISTLSSEENRIDVILRFFKKSRFIETEIIADWNVKHRLLKSEFGCNIVSRTVNCDTSAGIISRETHRNTSWQQARFETCVHNWFDYSESDAGIAVINENKYGMGIGPDSLSLSLIRSPIRPDPESDIGKHDFCYLIYPHEGNTVTSNVNKLGLEYNNPLVNADVSCNITDFEPLYLQALKLSENGSMFVYRLSEQNGTRGKIKLDKTYKVLNMLEDVISETSCLEYSPYEIITLGEVIDD